MAHEHSVEPAAAALTPRNCAKLRASLAEALAGLVIELSWKRSLPNARRIGFGNTKHETDVAWSASGARGGLPRNCVRRGHKRVGSVIDIKKSPLRPFEQNALIGLSCRLQASPYRAHKRKDLWRDFAQAARDVTSVGFIDAHTAAKGVVMRKQLFNFWSQTV